MNNQKLSKEYGTRPQGHGVDAAMWAKWEADYDSMSAEAHSVEGIKIPKNLLAREIFLAGRWVQFQLEKQSAPASHIQQACADVGTSALLFVIDNRGMRWEPQDLWKAARRLAKIEGDE